MICGVQLQFFGLVRLGDVIVFNNLDYIVQDVAITGVHLWPLPIKKDAEKDDEKDDEKVENPKLLHVSHHQFMAQPIYRRILHDTIQVEDGTRPGPDAEGEEDGLLLKQGRQFVI